MQMEKHKYEKHGMYNTKLYRAWNNMISRCYCEKHRRYKDYGGRGIIVCNCWKISFTCFKNWALANGYAEELTIDRIDVNGNYEPLNCRWISNKEQQHNKRTSKLIEYNGEIHTQKQWSEMLGIQSKTLEYRLKRWGVEEAFNKPLQKHCRRKTG